MQAPPQTPRGPRRSNAEAGFSLVEILLATAILAIALLGNVSSSLTANHLGTMARARGDALRFADQFLERLRSDDDFLTLYQRLDALQMATQPAPSGGAGSEGTAGGSESGGGGASSGAYGSGGSPEGTTAVETVTFNDGTTALPVTAYYADFEAPEDLGSVGVLVEIPGVGSDALNPGVLLENAVDERFALPFDLNGDGVVDANPRNDDYIALPVFVRFRMQTEGAHAHEFRVPTWIRGIR